MPRYSYSAINTYLNCPRQFLLAYVERREQPRTEAAAVGTEVHECVAEYVRHLVRAGLQTDLDYIASLGVSSDARGVLETFAGTHLFEPGDYLVEHRHQVRLAEDVDYSGVIDLLRDRGEELDITDYKSFWRALSQSEVESSLQLRGYALLAFDLFPDARRVNCRMDFVRLGVVREMTLEREDADAVRQELLRHVSAIEKAKEAGDFPARPGGHCEWCGGKGDCPALASGLEAITCAADAAALADEYIVLEARRREIQGLLKPYVTREGALARNGLVVGYHTSDGVSYDLPALVSVLERAGYGILDYVRPDATAIKKAAKADSALAEALTAIARDASKSTFAVRREAA